MFQSITPIVDYLLQGNVGDEVYNFINLLYGRAGTKLLFTKPAGDLLFGFEEELYTLIVNLLEGITGEDLPDTFGLFSTVNRLRF